MSELDIVRQFARQSLTVETPAGQPDNSLWDRARRVVCNIEHICRLPELPETGSQIDRFCLTAAVYFCDAGFARLADSNDSGATGALPDLNTDDLRHLSAEIVTERLGPILPTPKIDKINRIIIESGDRFTNMTEAMILSDARNLDDMGAVGIFNEFRRCPASGKAVTDALQSWKRKIDYRYWQARLKEGFRFETVRSIAVQRLAAAESFMRQLSIENTARDLEESISETMQETPER